MADLNVTDVVITEEATYSFDQNAAKAAYTTSAPYGLVITTGSGATQATPSAPAADPIGNNTVNQDKCVFFNGGDLPNFTYTKTVNGTRGWKWTWKYNVTGAVVAPKTAWNYQVTVPGVDPEVPINATLAGLSAMSSKQHPLKFSFSLLADDGITSRIENVKITVDGTEYPLGHTVISGTDFKYNSNAGTFGTASLLSGTDGQYASSILLNDSFTGNDAISNAICAKVDEIKPTLGVGTHTITLTATVKGNSGVASTDVSVTKTVIISGGCN